MALARGNSNDETAIRLSVHDTIAAFNAQNAGAPGSVQRGYGPGDDKGERLQGRIEIEGRLGDLFTKPEIALKQRLLDLTIRFVRDDMALVHVEIEMSGAVSASGDRSHHIAS